MIGVIVITIDYDKKTSEYITGPTVLNNAV
jgi:hypothetical protein